MGLVVHVDETGCVSPFVCLFNVMTHTKNNNTIINYSKVEIHVITNLLQEIRLILFLVNKDVTLDRLRAFLSKGVEKCKVE